MKTKSELRNEYKAKRKQLTPDAVEELSLQIANESLKLDIWDKTYYHVFLPIAEKKEVNTEYILHILQGKDKSVVLPKASFETGQMKHILLQENTVLKTSNYGITEPVSGIEINATQLDVVFIPLLAYDLEGNRIGYGKGFYDRFLTECNPNTLFVGLSFFEPENEIPNELMDVPLDFCITPMGNYIFEKKS